MKVEGKYVMCISKWDLGQLALPPKGIRFNLGTHDLVPISRMIGNTMDVVWG